MEFPDAAAIESLLNAQPLPSFARVEIPPQVETVSDPVRTVREETDRLLDDAENALAPGATVAVGVGSRGIHGIDTYIETVVTTLSDRGFEPVIVPAMGSHGGATADGQRGVLAALGITPERVGAPIDARMETTRLDERVVGATTYPVAFSTAALEADAIVVVNRVKPHTNFTGPIESGLCKMLVAGLGKQRGAKAFHATALAEGYVAALETAFDVIAEAAPVIGGVALVENADDETAHIEAVPCAEMREREPAILDRAREAMATLPVSEVDLLVVDEIGKEISGAGMDTNVVGRYRVLNAPDPDDPEIKLIYARGLSDETGGNAMGIGLADITRQAAVDSAEMTTTYANALTSGSLAKVAIPVVAPNDELALQIALSALGGTAPEARRILWIRNTQQLRELYVSEAVIGDLPANATVHERCRLVFEEGTARFDPV